MLQNVILSYVLLHEFTKKLYGMRNYRLTIAHKL